MEGVPPDIEPDVIMSKKGKGAKSRNKLKSDSGDVPKVLIDASKAKSVSNLVNKFESEVNLPGFKGLNEVSNPDNDRSGSKLSDSSSGEGIGAMLSDNKEPIEDGLIDFAKIGSESSSSHSVADFNGSYVFPISNSQSIKKEDGSISDLSSPVLEFEKDIALFCSPGEKNSMMIFWNSLFVKEKEGFVHGLRFTKKKYNVENAQSDAVDDSIDNIKKFSSVSQRNDYLMNWKDLS